MVLMQAVDSFRLIKIGEGAGAQFRMLAQLALFVTALGGGALAVLPAFPFRIDVPADLHRHQLLDVSNIGECARQVAMLRVAPLEMFNRAGEKLERLLVVSLAAD